VVVGVGVEGRLDRFEVNDHATGCGWRLGAADYTRTRVGGRRRRRNNGRRRKRQGNVLHAVIHGRALARPAMSGGGGGGYQADAVPQTRFVSGKRGTVARSRC